MKKTLTCRLFHPFSLKGLTSAVVLGGLTILNTAFAQTTDTYSTVGTTTWTVPNGVSSITIQSWGAGGGGGARAGCASSCQQTATGGGGKGGMFAGSTISVTPGDVLSITVGAGGTGGVGNTSAGGAGGASYVSAASVVVVRALGGNGGNSGNLSTNGSGATAQNTAPGSEIGTIFWYGGNGVGGLKTTSRQSGGGGGGGAGDASNGVAAVNPAGGSGGPTGVSAGGAGGTANGGAGGTGGSGTNTGTTAGSNGSVRGGGGGGARGYSSTSQVAANGGTGGRGEVRLTYNTCAANAGAALAYICEGGTSAALGGSVSGQSTTGIWSDGGIGGTFSPAATDLNATWTAPAAYTGTATLTLTTTNGGCPVNGTATKTIAVAVAPSAPVFNTGAATICQGSTATYGATAAGISPSVTYSILSGGASIDANSGTVSNVTGNFTVRATAANNCGSAHTDFAVTVTPAPAIPIISPNGPTTFCAGGSVILSSSQATGNVWSSSQTTQTNTVSQSGDYTVTYTDGNGCSSTSAITSVIVNANPQPVITPGSLTTFCEGGSVVLTSSAASGNVWSTGETTNSIEVDDNDVVTVTSTSNGCSSTSAAITVTVNAAPATPVITSGSSTTFCEGGSVVLSSSAATGNVWSSSETTQTNTVSDAGSYTVTVTNGNGCTATSAATVVTVNPNPSVPVITAGGVTTFCEGQTVTLTSSASTGNEWSTGEIANSIIVDESASITVTVTDGNGCTATSAATDVLVNPNPEPMITASGAISFCEGGSVTISSSATSGNVWSTGETTNSIVVDESDDITVTVTDANGCSGVSNEIEVVENSATAPVITADGPTSFCVGGSVTITSSEASGNQWSTGETGTNITVTETMAVTVTNNSGCSSGISNTITVAANPLPAVPVITADGPTTICGNGSVVLSSSTTGNVWSNGETTNHITVTAAGSYSVVTTNGNGCSATSLPVVISLNPVPVALVTLTNDITITASPSGQSYQWITCPDNEAVTGATAIAFSAAENGSYAVVVTNSFGCKDTSACIVISKVGIDDLAELSGITLYPNPSSGMVTLTSDFEEAVNLTVFDASGKALLQGVQLSGALIDLTAFEAGIYIFRMETSKGISSHRMIIE